MKLFNVTLFSAMLLLLMACQKEKKDEPVTKPVEFTNTEYAILAPYDSSGKPDNLEKDVIHPELISHFRQSVPGKDLTIHNPSLLNNNSTEDLKIVQKSDVYLTYVINGAEALNAIAFYTYPTGNPPTSPNDIKKITYVFPSAGGKSPLQPGDKVKIGTFDPGTTIGLVLLKNAWNPNTKTLDNKAVHFCYNDALNPEVDQKLKKHVVLVNYPAENKILIGFEDVDRTTPGCDNDFDDVVLYATIKKI